MFHQVVRNSADETMAGFETVDPATRVAVITAELEQLVRQANSSPIAGPRSSAFVRAVMAARIARRRYFDPDLFADPAWDILLELYALECEGCRTSVSKLCIAAAVPMTTALRWIDKLAGQGLIRKTNDPMDARRVWVSISPVGQDLMDRYLGELSLGTLPL